MKKEKSDIFLKDSFKNRKNKQRSVFFKADEAMKKFLKSNGYFPKNLHNETQEVILEVEDYVDHEKKVGVQTSRLMTIYVQKPGNVSLKGLTKVGQFIISKLV